MLTDSAKGGTDRAQADFQSLPGEDGVLLKRVGMMRGETLYSLIIRPYHYDSSTRRLSYYTTIEIKLTSSLPFPSNFGDLSETLAKNPAREVRTAPQAHAPTYIRIVVNNDGIYHVSGKDLDTAGANLGGFTLNNMTLWNRGRQIPIYVYSSGSTAFTKDGYFEFYGTANRINYSSNRPDLYLDPYTDENVYFLTSDSLVPAQRLVTESGAPGRASGAVDLSGYSFTQKAHLEKDLKFERLDAVHLNKTYDKQDHWFWGEVSSGRMVNFDSYLAYPDTTSIQPLTLTAAFQGITHFDGSVAGALNVPDEHQAELFVNGYRVLATTWDDQTVNIVRTEASANIPQSALHHGANSFGVYNANAGDAAVSTLALNWIELQYQRLYVADKDYLEFSVPDNARPGYYRFFIRRFLNSSISIYRLSGSRITDFTITHLEERTGANGYAVLFESFVQSPADKFIAVSDGGKLKPLRIERVSGAGLSSRDYSADYIVIAGRELVDMTANSASSDNPVSRLASWYNSRGTKTLVVNPVQIYDDFSYGIKSPYAIRDFISYAYSHWAIAPRYVLLAGTGTWNTKSTNRQADMIPVMMMQTYKFGAAACDNFYACVDGDDPVPDVAVGRIPAANMAQMEAVVDKILSYGSGRSFGWQNTVLLIAGEENEFHRQIDSVVHSMVPANYFINRLYTSIHDPVADAKYYGGTQELTSDINRGAVFVNYLGHGGGAVWADNGVLTNDEVRRLSNSGKCPFVASMTCFTGAFDGQFGVPLSSTLLFAENKGAIGTLASSGLGWLYNDFFMVSELVPILFDSARTASSVGMDIAFAKAKYYAAYSAFWPQAETMVNQYNLIGDPALTLQIPESRSKVRLDSYIAAPGQNISGTISDGVAGGTCVVQLTDNAGDVIGQTVAAAGNDGSARFSIPYNAGPSDPSHVKAYIYNSSSQRSSVADITTAGSFVQVTGIAITSDRGVLHIRMNALVSSVAASVTSAHFAGGVFPAGGIGGTPPALSLNIPLRESAKNEYTTDYSISADSLKPGSVIMGEVFAEYSDGSADSSRPVTYVVPGAADISAFPRQGITHGNPSIEVLADTLIRLQAAVYNWNSNPAGNVRIDFFDGSRQSGTFLGSTRVDFDTASHEIVSVPVTLSPESHVIYMYVVFDSLTNGFDVNPGNDFALNTVNVNAVAADKDGSAIYKGATLAGANPGEIFRVDTASPALYFQPSLIFARDTNGRARFYGFTSTSTSRSGGYTVSVVIEDPDSAAAARLNSFKLYQYDPRTRTLNLAGGRYVAGSVSAHVGTPGTFTVAYSSDNTPPQLSISVGDQFFSNGDFVPPDPRFSVLIQDPDGVDLRRGSIEVGLDGQPVDPSLVILPDSVYNPASVAGTVQIPARDGAHEIQITAMDANGNVAGPVTANFVVRSDFSLRVFGAYPNPFVSRTFIAFEVTAGNPIEAVLIRIYTVSGRSVKTIRYPSSAPGETIGLLEGGTGSPTAVGYHEAWWDGTDNSGNQVANGVYFYKVSVTSGGKTLFDIGKMARLR